MYLYLGRCAFGIDTDMQNDINNPYLQKSAEFFKIDADDLLIFRLGNLLSFLARPLNYIVFSLKDVRAFLIKLIPSLGRYLREIPAVWIMNRLQEVLDVRTQSTSNLKKRVDLLQLMIDSSTHDKVIVT
jgi:hypothetical protein